MAPILHISSEEVWTRLTPYLKTQSAFGGLRISGLSSQRMREILKQIDARKTQAIILEPLASRFDKVPPELSRYTRLRSLSLSNWTGRNFPDPWSLGLTLQQLEVDFSPGGSQLAIPDSVLRQPQLRSIKIFGPVNELAIKALDLPFAEIIAPRLAGFPDGICSYSIGGYADLPRSNMSSLEIWNPNLSTICDGLPK